MFETVENAEIPIPPIFGCKGQRMWSYVELRLHMPWFYVVYRFNTEDGMTMHHMFLLSRVEQLQQAVQERGIEIEEVHIVLPRHMNGKDKWTMEPLAEVWEGTEPEAEGQAAYVYVIADRTRYVDSALNTKEADLLNKELIYAASKSACRTTR